jgi:AcrR family transcriptional regulator
LEQLTQRQEEIVKASIETISEKGIQHLTIKNIAKKLGFSEPAVYRHFKSKMDILVAIITQFKISSKMLSTTLKRDGLTSLDKIGQLYSSTFEQFTKTPELTAVLFSEEIFQHEEMLSKIVTKIMDNHQSLLEGIIADGQKVGEIRDDIPYDQLAIILMGSLRLLVTRWKLKKHNFSLIDEGDHLVDNLTKILSK